MFQTGLIDRNSANQKSETVLPPPVYYQYSTMGNV